MAYHVILFVAFDNAGEKESLREHTRPCVFVYNGRGYNKLWNTMKNVLDIKIGVALVVL